MVATIPNGRESQTVRRMTIVEGGNPSLEQIESWLQRRAFIDIIKSTDGKTTAIKGRIKSIEPPYLKSNRVICLKGHRYGISWNEIMHFKEIEFVDLAQKKDKDLVVNCGDKKFLLNRERLQAKIPYFQGMSNFSEGTKDEIDLSQSLSLKQFKLILKYVDNLLDFDSMHASDAVELLLAADYLCMMNEIKDNYSLILKVPIINQFTAVLNGRSTHIALECRTYEGSLLLAAGSIATFLDLANRLGRIKSLDIFNVNDEDLPPLVKCIKGNTQLKSLSISWNNIRMREDSLTDKSAPLLATLIQELPALAELKIQNHNIGDASLKSIATALEGNTSLKKLDLTHNQFSCEGFNDLTKKLLQNQTLKTLILTANGNIGHKMSNNGPYIEALSKNKSLEHLYLGNMSINDSGAEGLAAIIKANATLKTLDLWGNRISFEGGESLKNALRTNSCLANLVL